MTGLELIAKLKESGTGKAKIAQLEDFLSSIKKPTVGDVIEACRQFGYQGTIDKASGFLGGKLDAVKPGAIFDQLDAVRTENEQLKAENADLKKQLAAKK